MRDIYSVYCYSQYLSRKIFIETIEGLGGPKRRYAVFHGRKSTHPGKIGFAGTQLMLPPRPKTGNRGRHVDNSEKPGRRRGISASAAASRTRADLTAMMAD